MCRRPAPWRRCRRAELTLASGVVERIWTQENLERPCPGLLAPSEVRATFGLVRVVYGEDSRSVVLLRRRLVLLRFRSPEYDVGADRAGVTWRIARGVLVAPEGRDGGFPRIAVERGPGAEHEDGERRVLVRLGGPQLLSVAARQRALAGSGPGSTARPSCASTDWSATRSCARSAGASLRQTQHRDREPPGFAGARSGKVPRCESWSPVRRASWADC